MAELIPLADLKGNPGSPGANGINAVGSAANDSALADFVNKVGGVHLMRDALDALYSGGGSGSGEGLLAYAENRTAQGTTATVTGNWGNINGVLIHIPPTTQDVFLFWSAVIGLSVPGQGNVYTAPWDLTGANIPSVSVAGSDALTRCRTNDVISSYIDHHHGFSNIGSSTTDRIIGLCCKTGQEGSSLAGYVKNGNAGFDHTWMAAVTQ